MRAQKATRSTRTKTKDAPRAGKPRRPDRPRPAGTSPVAQPRPARALGSATVLGSGLSALIAAATLGRRAGFQRKRKMASLVGKAAAAAAAAASAPASERIPSRRKRAA